jgi:hypothetical protein
MRNISAPADLIPRDWKQNRAEPMMKSRNTEASEMIDQATSRSVCDAIGERLRQSLSSEASHPSPRLEQLMAELQKRDRGNRALG